MTENWPVASAFRAEPAELLKQTPNSNSHKLFLRGQNCRLEMLFAAAHESVSGSDMAQCPTRVRNRFKADIDESDNSERQVRRHGGLLRADRYAASQLSIITPPHGRCLAQARPF
jgi:hypothetical protein